MSPLSFLILFESSLFFFLLVELNFSIKFEFVVTTSILGNWLNLSYKGACVLFQFGGKICYPVVNWQYLFRVGFLILHTIGILSQILLCCGRMSWCCRMLNSIPGLCSLDGEIAPLPQL